jgi:hypothetical protein
MGPGRRDSAEAVGVTSVEAAENAEEHIHCVSLPLCVSASRSTLKNTKDSEWVGRGRVRPPVC